MLSPLFMAPDLPSKSASHSVRATLQCTLQVGPRLQAEHVNDPTKEATGIDPFAYWPNGPRNMHPISRITQYTEIS